MSQLSVEFETAFAVLLQPSMDSQNEGFKHLKSLLKMPGAEAALCECIAKSQNPGIRRYASTVLRRKVLKSKMWNHTQPEVKEGIKQTVLNVLMIEIDKQCRNSIVHLIAAIAKHELPKGLWIELMELINKSVISCDTSHREMGLFTLSVIAKRMGTALKPHYKSLLVIFSKTLLDTSSAEIPFYTVQAMASMVQGIGTEEMSVFQAMIPTVMTVIRNFANANNEEKACDSMEIFEELLESEVAIIVPHVKSLIGLCLELAANENIDDSLRIKALNILRYLIELKKKTILKHKLVKSILDIVFPLMCKGTPNDFDEEDDQQSLPSVAAQTIDAMALHFPPEKLIPPLMLFFEPAIKSTDPVFRKAAYLGLAVIAEGCSEHIRHKCLPAYIEVICKGMKDESAMVRNAALFSLGQYAEFLQPDISKYASDVLPLLFEYLNQTFVSLQQGEVNSISLKKTFYAVETFCENLEEGFLPYLEVFMNCLMTFLTIETSNSKVIRELAVGAIGSVAAASKENFATYFDSVLNKLKLFLSQESNTESNSPKQNEEDLSLQVHSVEALAVIARNVGAKTFMPVAHDCVKLGLHLIETVDDPELRRAVYNMFGSVAIVLKSDMLVYIPTIVDRMMLSISCSEGLQPKFLDAAPTFRLFEEDEEEEDEDQDNDMEDESNLDEQDETSGDIVGFTMENEYMNEKESACFALKDFAAELDCSFLQHLGPCFNEIVKQIDNPVSDVRRAVVFALGQFVMSYGKAFDETGALEHKSALELRLGILLPKLYSLTREDTDRQVVLACLETLEDLIKNLGQKALSFGTVDNIMELVKEVYVQKLGCQDSTDAEEEDSEEAEYDTMLMEYAGELVGALVKVVPMQEFAKHLSDILPFLHHKAKLKNSTAEKSFSIGALADIVSSMEKGACIAFYPELQLSFLNGTRDENGEVRSNSAFGLGVLIENAGEMCFEHYPIFLQAFSTMLSKEEYPRAQDNLCAAMARLILTNVSGVPMNVVFIPFLQCLPLKDDLDENEVVYKCIYYLHSIRCEELFQNLPQVLTILAEVLASQKIDENTQALIVNLIKSVHLEFPVDFETVHKALPPAFAEALIKVL